MGKRLAAILFVLSLAGCGVRVRLDEAASPAPIEAPRSIRVSNWGEHGSCCFASVATLLNLQSQFASAAHILASHGGGSCDTMLAAFLDAHGIRYAMTSGDNDVEFLSRACRTRRGCGVQLRGFYSAGDDHYLHMVTLIHLDSERAVLIDNNFPDSFVTLPAGGFVRWWKASESWAVTPVYTPAPPTPF